jgi:hypothetical protein
VPIQRIVWTGQGVKVYSPDPIDIESCELYGGRRGVVARIVKATRQSLWQLIIRRGRGAAREEIIFSKRRGEPAVERVVQAGGEVKDLV